MLFPRLVVLLSLFFALPAFAGQPDKSAVDAAKSHQDLGEAFFKAEKFAEARIEFEAAYALSQEPDLLYNLALCWERQGSVRDAADAYDRYLRARPTDAATRAKVALMRAQLAPVVPPATTTEPKRKLSTRKVTGAVLVALGGASLVACIALGAVTARDRQTLESGSLTFGEAKTTADRATTTRAASIALGTLGGAAVVVGIPLIVWR